MWLALPMRMAPITLLKAGSTNIRMQYPTNGASATSMGCAMIEGCPHPEAAKAMIDFLMSPEGQTELANRLANPALHQSQGAV